MPRARSLPLVIRILLLAATAPAALVACPEPTPPLDVGDLRRLDPPPTLTPLPRRPAPPTPAGFVIETPWRTPGAAPIPLDPVIDALALIVRDINASVVVPRDVPIQLIACGKLNAFYDPTAPRIVICDELVQFFAVELGQRFPDDQRYLEVLTGAVAFTLMHEIAHALFRELAIPNVGNDESAADTMATVLLLDHGGALIAGAGAAAFLVLAEWKDRQRVPLAFWDEHQLDVQRFYEVSCLIYGSDPERFGNMLASQTLPWERARVCPARFRDDAAAVRAQLAPHVR